MVLSQQRGVDPLVARSQPRLTCKDGCVGFRRYRGSGRPLRLRGRGEHQTRWSQAHAEVGIMGLVSLIEF